MRYRSLKTLAAASLLIGSGQALAAPQPAQSLSIARAAVMQSPAMRAGAPQKEGKSALAGNGLGFGLLALVVVGGGYGIYEMTKDDDSDYNYSPVSP